MGVQEILHHTNNLDTNNLDPNPNRNPTVTVGELPTLPVTVGELPTLMYLCEELP